jgi:inorganic pyrophosphatase
MADDLIEIMVEIPKGSRNKYEFDHERNIMRLDRRLFSATVYPADYGFLPDTLGEDGDPLDAMVLLEDATFPGCLVEARPVGVFWMEDEKGPDAKIICVPDEPNYEHVRDIQDMGIHLRDEIEHFFSIYKDLEPNKSSSTAGYGGREEAWKQIEEARVRFTETGGH